MVFNDCGSLRRLFSKTRRAMTRLQGSMKTETLNATILANSALRQALGKRKVDD